MDEWLEQHYRGMRMVQQEVRLVPRTKPVTKVCGRCGHAQTEHSWGVGSCRTGWLQRCESACRHYVQRDA